jgi:hypothetical protein
MRNNHTVFPSKRFAVVTNVSWSCAGWAVDNVVAIAKGINFGWNPAVVERHGILLLVIRQNPQLSGFVFKLPL